MNWSQILEEIPSSLVIMSHREWDSGEDGMGENDGGSQTPITEKMSMFQAPSRKSGGR